MIETDKQKGYLETSGHAEAAIGDSWEMTRQVGGEKEGGYQECEKGLDLNAGKTLTSYMVLIIVIYFL